MITFKLYSIVPYGESVNATLENTVDLKLGGTITLNDSSGQKFMRIDYLKPNVLSVHPFTCVANVEKQP